LLALRRGVVRAVEEDGGAEQRVSVEHADRGGHHPAIADVRLVGRCEIGDDVVVNVAARELGLGSGGFDIVHVNLTRGLGSAVDRAALVMKFNYTSLQHGVVPLEAGRGEYEPGVVGPVGVIALHSQLAPVAWAFGQARPEARLGYVQTVGGALPGSHSRVVGELEKRGLLVSHVTAGAAFGGRDGDAITAAGALDAGFAELGWDAVVVGPGPGIVGSASRLGHGGLAALDSAHAALALGAVTVIVPRLSSGDERPRHSGLSHHSRTVLEMALGKLVVAWPENEPLAEGEVISRHAVCYGSADLDGYAASGLPALIMDRTIDSDPLFFAGALAGGAVLGDGF
jgi:hypothetical protein